MTPNFPSAKRSPVRKNSLERGHGLGRVGRPRHGAHDGRAGCVEPACSVEIARKFARMPPAEQQVRIAPVEFGRTGVSGIGDWGPTTILRSLDDVAKFEAATDANKKKALADQICMELTIHTKIEEDVFYPACEGKVEEDLLKEAYVEHDGAKVLIAEIEAGGPDDEFYDAKVKVLQEEIEHHVEEEEKRMEGLFAQARKAGLDMDALGQELAARKQALTDQFKASGIPSPHLKTMGEVSV